MNLKSKISEIAYALWQEAGCPENKDLDFWLIAEKRHKLLETFENTTDSETIDSETLMFRQCLDQNFIKILRILDDEPTIVGNNKLWEVK
jgi:hypothetical protein